MLTESDECPYMKEKAESCSRVREVKKRASTTEFHACIPSTASCREPTCLWAERAHGDTQGVGAPLGCGSAGCGQSARARIFSLEP